MLVGALLGERWARAVDRGGGQPLHESTMGYRDRQLNVYVCLRQRENSLSVHTHRHACVTALVFAYLSVSCQLDTSEQPCFVSTSGPIKTLATGLVGITNGCLYMGMLWVGVADAYMWAMAMHRAHRRGTHTAGDTAELANRQRVTVKPPESHHMRCAVCIKADCVAARNAGLYIYTYVHMGQSVCFSDDQLVSGDVVIWIIIIS